LASVPGGRNANAVPALSRNVVRYLTETTNTLVQLTKFHPKYNNNIVLLITTVVAFLICVTQINSLNSKSYILRQTDFFGIDSVKMLAKAFLIGNSSGRSIEFEDENRKTFSISDSRYDALSKTSNLYDTLQYSALVMKVFTNKEGYDRYFNESNSDKIEVYDIQIGETSYINLAEVNREEYNSRLATIIFIAKVYGICLIYYLYKRVQK
jgi:hypothetical protein